MSTNITIPVPAVPFAPPVYTCHRAKKPFELDGNINLADAIIREFPIL